MLRFGKITVTDNIEDTFPFFFLSVASYQIFISILEDGYADWITVYMLSANSGKREGGMQRQKQ